MLVAQTRKSWDTSIKHYYRLGLEDNIPTPMRKNISSSNKFRWRNEKENKYEGCSMSNFIQEELQLIKRIGQSTRDKKTIQTYLKLSDTFREIIKDVKGVKLAIKNQKELIVNTIEDIKDTIPINDALRFFNISRTTYQNYKSLVIHKCNASYFSWCTRKFPNQLLTSEVEVIKTYMTNNNYLFWSKASVYLRAVRDNNLHCCLSTFYKYCRLLGYANLKKYTKSKNDPLVTTRPNEVWCADVTVFKTADGVKHYIHILMDHFSKKILGYSVEKSNSGKTIRSLLQKAYLNYKPIDTLFLTDGGCENVNSDVSSLIASFDNSIIHRIAQKDVLFSNAMIEAFNKTLKYEFLFSKPINSGTGLIKIIDESIPIYNNHRPQWSLKGNTPNETFLKTPIDFSKYSISFGKQKTKRLAQNKENSCRACLN